MCSCAGKGKTGVGEPGWDNTQDGITVCMCVLVGKGGFFEGSGQSGRVRVRGRQTGQNGTLLNSVLDQRETA